VDYGVCANLNIYAPAPGVVVFAGPLTVRGNATIIDHGWGVYSGFYHQSEIKVKVGDKVEAGQLIGLIGGTGRVTGPHLHWDVFVNGIQVQPLDWLEKAFQ
jgi:murein DD-endopeptidase MepM/ murein hydrolase activator NlpD